MSSPDAVAERQYAGRLAHVTALATYTLGTPAKASSWLGHANLALAGQRPLDLLNSDAGMDEVATILRRIEYGIYS